ncbi:sensor domain-containing phosphodiesterase [Rhodococcoides yunnanense]|uniref:sensor domain-containing phosphodiesterase n=1 Tax=Rhodococcoides yunnanense TaxID=278209 RepID=UPI0009326A7F|nr:EAL domain-containing protein [Rhodococcus yunnanensis]
MVRTRIERQKDSARKYLDFAAVSPALENATAVTAQALGFPVAMVNILDDGNQYTLVAYGIEDLAGCVVPRSQAACTTVVELGHSLVVGDASLAGAATADSPLHTGSPGHALIASMRDAGFRSYASVPLFGRESIPIGTLCVLDAQPHDLTLDQVHLLEQLGVMVEDHLDVQRSRSRVFTPVGNVTELTAAIDTGEIAPWYEPIVDLGTGKIFALEALARWQHPIEGLVEPGDFIVQMETTDLIVDLDLRILAAACQDFSRWTMDRPCLKLSVNVSGHHLDRPDCVDRILSIVTNAGLPAEAIILEITETARGTMVEDEARMVRALRAAGFTVLLDDLGSGWSPVPRLMHVSVDGFKLDRTVASALHTKVGHAVAHAMLQFADELGLSVILEGLETVARLDAARVLGFRLGQGHHFSKAVPEQEVPAVIKHVEELMREHLESSDKPGD